MSDWALRVFHRRFLMAFVNFLLIACIGTLLRLVYVSELLIIPDYKNVLHAHSHAAMMGWVYSALSSALLVAFTPEASLKRVYARLFWINQVCILSLIPLFWLNGYALPSIVVSAIHVVITYVFGYHFLKDIKVKYMGSSYPIAVQFARIAVLFLLLSSIGLWGMAPAMSMLHGTQKVVAYYLSVQFYMHFQYNGWFIFGVLALFFSLIPLSDSKERKNSMSISLLVMAVVLTFSLSLFWGFPNYPIFLWIAVLSATIQLPTTLFLFHRNWEWIKAWLHAIPKRINWLFMVAFVSLCTKQLLQIIIIYPEMARTAFILRNYVIAYLHLTFLGITTIALITYALTSGGMVVASHLTKIALWGIVACIFLIELILGILGSFSWLKHHVDPYFYLMLFLFSLVIVCFSLVLILANTRRGGFTSG